MPVPVQRIVIVAGASRSGKTTLAAKLAPRLGCAHFELDRLYGPLVEAMRGWRGYDADESRAVMGAASGAVVAGLVAGGRSLIIDGGWIEPEAAVALAAAWPDVRFDIVFLGYPSAALAERLRLGLRWRWRWRHNWLARQGRTRAAAFVAAQIAGSRYYAAECVRLGLRFIDVGGNPATLFDRLAAELSAAAA